MVHQILQLTDVTPLLVAASNRRQNWSGSKATAILERIRPRFDRSTIDWESGDEEWAALLTPDFCIARLCSRLPMAMVETWVLGQVAQEFSDEVTVLCVPSFSSPVLRIDRVVAEGAFGVTLSESVDWNAMSASDFWWATI